MRIPVAMPKLGYDMEAGKIVAWAKAPQQRVERGEVIAEVESDKGVIEVEAMASGTLVEIVHDAGAEVQVGETIAYIEGGTA